VTEIEALKVGQDEIKSVFLPCAGFIQLKKSVGLPLMLTVKWHPASGVLVTHCDTQTSECHTYMTAI
jgi:hypothetical protein